MSPSAKSLVLDLLSTVPAGSMPVRALITAGELFGIDANAIRVAVTRLAAAGLLRSDERGAYRIGPAAESLVTHVAAWRTLEERVRAWNGAWIAALTAAVPRSERAVRRRSERALRYCGFRHLEHGLAVRPDNLAGGASAARERLARLGLDERIAVFEATELDPARTARARGLWDAEHLDRGYHDLLSRLDASAARLPTLPRTKAMTESFLVGGATIRALVLDPLLPEPLVSATQRRNLASAMKDYDRLGRQCWSGFMKEHGAPHRRTPHDVRALETALAVTAG